MLKPIYLCGPIQGRADNECVTWRQQATRMLAPIPTLDPIRRDYRNNYGDASTAAQLVAWDEEDIRASAALLVMFDRPSVGSAMEVRMAAKEVKIPVYTIDISNATRSPWLIHHTTAFFVSLEEACAFLRLQLRPNYGVVRWQRRLRGKRAILYPLILELVLNNSGRYTQAQIFDIFWSQYPQTRALIKGPSGRTLSPEISRILEAENSPIVRAVSGCLYANCEFRPDATVILKEWRRETTIQFNSEQPVLFS